MYTENLQINQRINNTITSSESASETFMQDNFIKHLTHRFCNNQPFNTGPPEWWITNINLIARRKIFLTLLKIIFSLPELTQMVLKLPPHAEVYDYPSKRPSELASTEISHAERTKKWYSNLHTITVIFKDLFTNHMHIGIKNVVTSNWRTDQ